MRLYSLQVIWGKPDGNIFIECYWKGETLLSYVFPVLFENSRPFLCGYCFSSIHIPGIAASRLTGEWCQLSKLSLSKTLAVFVYKMNGLEKPTSWPGGGCKMQSSAVLTQMANQNLVSRGSNQHPPSRLLCCIFCCLVEKAIVRDPVQYLLFSLHLKRFKYAD